MRRKPIIRGSAIVFGACIVAVVLARASSETANLNLVIVLILFVASVAAGYVAAAADSGSPMMDGARSVALPIVAFLLLSIAVNAAQGDELRIANALILWMVLTSLGIGGAALRGFVRRRREAATQ
jgi:hypothetical protein